MFFNVLCLKVINLEALSIHEKSMIRTLCEMKKIFPPLVFIVMMHLPIHLAYEVYVCGPVCYRWMYPFERYIMNIIKYFTNFYILI